MPGVKPPIVPLLFTVTSVALMITEKEEKYRYWIELPCGRQKIYHWATTLIGFPAIKKSGGMRELYLCATTVITLTVTATTREKTNVCCESNILWRSQHIFNFQIFCLNTCSTWTIKRHVCDVISGWRDTAISQDRSAASFCTTGKEGCGQTQHLLLVKWLSFLVTLLRFRLSVFWLSFFLVSGSKMHWWLILSNTIFTANVWRFNCTYSCIQQSAPALTITLNQGVRMVKLKEA